MPRNYNQNPGACPGSINKILQSKEYVVKVTVSVEPVSSLAKLPAPSVEAYYSWF
jgi:hypothetical protein